MLEKHDFQITETQQVQATLALLSFLQTAAAEFIKRLRRRRSGGDAPEISHISSPW